MPVQGVQSTKAATVQLKANLGSPEVDVQNGEVDIKHQEKGVFQIKEPTEPQYLKVEAFGPKVGRVELQVERERRREEEVRRELGDLENEPQREEVDL